MMCDISKPITKNCEIVSENRQRRHIGLVLSEVFTGFHFKTIIVTDRCSILILGRPTWFRQAMESVNKHCVRPMHFSSGLRLCHKHVKDTRATALKFKDFWKIICPFSQIAYRSKRLDTFPYRDRPINGNYLGSFHDFLSFCFNFTFLVFHRTQNPFELRFRLTYPNIQQMLYQTSTYKMFRTKLTILSYKLFYFVH